MIKGFLAGIVLTVFVLVGGVFYYFASGMAPVATADPMMPFEKRLAGMALNAHIEKQKVGNPPVPADEPNLLAGAGVYQRDCAVCHGLPGHPTEYVTMMFPKPPQLFKGKGVTDDPPSESYWKTANGIRLSGMPAFKDKLTDLELWQVTLLVAHATEIPASVKQVLVPAAPSPAAGPESAPKPAGK
jgi:thiosulfate dehydrogenase